jgi:hypothetical protein
MQGQINSSEFLSLVRQNALIAREAQRSVESIVLPEQSEQSVKDPRVNKDAHYYYDQGIERLLRDVGEGIADSYIQVASDLATDDRLTWMGTAHEIREMLRGILDTLAPVEEIRKTTWYKQESGTSGPTQKQKVRYISEQKKAGSAEKKLTDDLGVIEEKVEAFARDMYGRSSDAAHRSKNKTEAFKLLKYFEAFAFDMLG